MSTTHEPLITHPRTLRDCFRDLPDPRVVKRSTHALYDILAIVLVATIAGCDNFVSIADFAKSREKWFRERMGLKLLSGIPSHDTLQRVMSLLDPEEFQVAFALFVQVMMRRIPELQDRQIPIDGKAMRGSTHADEDGTKRMVHMVSAWSTEAGLALGQLPTDEKSNEIPTIPKLLDLLDISGALVSCDAMGCQTEIAAKIVNNNGDYLLQVKGNQPHLYEDILLLTQWLEGEKYIDFDRHQDDAGRKQHGRRERRETIVIDDEELLREFIRNFDEWKGLKCVVVTKSVREVDGQASQETRYHICSRRAPAAVLGRHVRRHWGIENNLHWILDVAFGEDDHRLYGGHAAANLSSVRRMALPLLKSPKVKLGIANRRLKASYDNEFLEEILVDFLEN